MQYKRLNEINLSNKTVLLRLDLNTPVENGLVVNNERILRSLPTLNFIIDAGAKLVIMSHLGRPEENDLFQEEFSLLPVVNEMENLLNKKIMFYSLGDFENLQSDNTYITSNPLRLSEGFDFVSLGKGLNGLTPNGGVGDGDSTVLNLELKGNDVGFTPDMVGSEISIEDEAKLLSFELARIGRSGK